MTTGAVNGTDSNPLNWPRVSIVFVVYNRRDPLRECLQRMLADSDYDPERLEVIVVDNASSDGSSAMVAEEFPHVGLIVRDTNIGVSAWNDGFARARGDLVLALDDDCYLPPDGLRRAVAAAQRRDADLVSFTVVSSHDRTHRFTEAYRTGLLSFWGCAVLIRRTVLESLEGYDPEIFLWANELEFMLRFFDRGFRHLHCPEIEAVHMKKPSAWDTFIPEGEYRINARHFAYVAAKLLKRRDAAEALVALVMRNLGDGALLDRVGFKALPDTLRGFAHGLRRRQPVQNSKLSRAYRRNFVSFASPWWLSLRPQVLLRTVPSEFARRVLDPDGSARSPRGPRDEYFARRARFYPAKSDILQF